jgi:hypothetical protein
MPSEEEKPVMANWELMAQINDVLYAALQNFIDGRIRRKLGGIDSPTMAMALHNFHKLMLVSMADQMFGVSPPQRRGFYEWAKQAFGEGMDDLIQRLDDNVIQSAIDESEGARKKKKGST